MDSSKFLSKVVGLYLIFISSAMLLQMQPFMHRVISLNHDAALMFSLGFICLILGLLMVIVHNLWQWNWKLIITLIGWMTLFKGAMLIIAPGYMDTLTIAFVKHIKIAYGVACFDLAIGILLTYIGFKKT